MKGSLKTIASLLKVYFLHLSMRQIFHERSACICTASKDFTLPTRLFIPFLLQIQPENNRNEIECQVERLARQLGSDPFNISIHTLLSFFSDNIINRYHETYRFSYEYCDIWRETTLLIDEEFFVISKIVQENTRRGMSKCSNYSWSYCIEHDNLYISKILNSGNGVSDNHFHLRGSSPYYLFSWIRMMANPTEESIEKYVKCIEDERLAPKTYYSEGSVEESFSLLWLKAVAIRLYLVLYLLNRNNQFTPTDVTFSSGEIGWILSQKQLPLGLPCQLQKQIDELRFSLTNPTQLDYIEVQNDNGFYSDLYGERWLISELYNGNHSKSVISMLYTYLAIKNRFRIELVQCNQVIGFDNFLRYQNRKDWFLRWSYASERRLTAATIASVIDGPKIHSLELRISPAYPYTQNTNLTFENIHTIRNYDKAIEDVINTNPQYSLDNFYYTFHFVKAAESFDSSSHFFCRHHQLRELIARQAESIIEMRKFSPEIARRVHGIDACNEEINCRPEVFGSIFRRLQFYDIHKEVPQLQATFHVAEDNYDVVDGLRAIHEAILFLGLRSGSRLGHATMLGISVQRFYEDKDMIINIPLQNYIDNIVWMYFFILENPRYFHEIQFILDFFRNKYQIYAEKLFQENNPDPICIPSIEAYYHSWLLRGDDPELYISFDRVPSVNSFNSYQLCGTLVKMNDVRKKFETRILYHQYHYNKYIRQNGRMPICEVIIPELLPVIETIQKVMQSYVARKEIGIECNPSSNLLISPIKSYQEHPIKVMFDKGLNRLSYHKTQLHASVNTDDKSVFSTSISNEYAYLAFGMEQMRDENGNAVYCAPDVYEWIELLKNNGNSQAFTNWDFIKRIPNKINKL